MTDGFQEEFEREHAKRDVRVPQRHVRAWADQLLDALPRSTAYIARNTPAACVAEQQRKLALLTKLAGDHSDE